MWLNPRQISGNRMVVVFPFSGRLVSSLVQAEDRKGGGAVVDSEDGIGAKLVSLAVEGGAAAESDRDRCFSRLRSGWMKIRRPSGRSRKRAVCQCGGRESGPEPRQEGEPMRLKSREGLRRLEDASGGRTGEAGEDEGAGPEVALLGIGDGGLDGDGD